MHITAKSKNALKVMLFMAERWCESEDALVLRSEIAASEGLSLEYLDQIIIPLRKRGLIQSLRGPKGGYRLRMKPNEISLWHIFHAVGDLEAPVRCIENIEASHCSLISDCRSMEPWKVIYDDVVKTFKKRHLSEFLDDSFGKQSKDRNTPVPIKYSSVNSATKVSGRKDERRASW